MDEPKYRGHSEIYRLWRRNPNFGKPKPDLKEKSGPEAQIEKPVPVADKISEEREGDLIKPQPIRPKLPMKRPASQPPFQLPSQSAQKPMPSKAFESVGCAFSKRPKTA